ncbi:unnamed protein product [Oreochromis niloticus]|nr:unnamed protein product [Mustela putorius furo]
MAETPNNLVVKTKTRQTQRNANAEASTMAEAQTEMVVTPKITILQRPKNELEKARRPNPEKSPVPQAQKEMVVKPKKTKKQKEKRVAVEPRRPITRSITRALLEAQNNRADGTNPRNKELPDTPEMSEDTDATSERENPGPVTISKAKEDMKMETEGNINNPSGQNPVPNGGTWQYQPKPTFRPHQDRVHFNPWQEITALRHQLQVSQSYQNSLYWKMIAANKRASFCQFQVNNLHAQIHENKRNHEEMIKDLIVQLEEASCNKPNNTSETEVLTNDNEVVFKLDEVMLSLQDQISHPTTEQCVVESATQDAEASHTDSVGLMSSKEAEFELKCRTQQEQIVMLQKQLLAAQDQLKEQAIKHSQEQEARNTEISDLKSQLCSNKALHDLRVETLERELKEAKAPSLKIKQEQIEENSADANEKQKSEPLKEKHTGGEEKMEKEDSVPSTSTSLQKPLEEKPPKEKDTTEQEKMEKEESATLSVQESLQQVRDKQKTLTAKVAELETEVKSLPEMWPIKKKKKQKRNWLVRLFT